jgi:tetratricopeptide (TPR) repeat protein
VGACVAARDFPGAVAVLRELSQAEQPLLERAESVSAGLVGLCPAELRTEARLLHGAVLGRLQRYAEAAEAHVSALAEAPAAYDAVKRALEALIERESRDRDLLLALATVEASQGSAGVSRACRIVRDVANTDAAGNCERALAVISDVRARHPAQLDLEVCALYVKLRQSPTSCEQVACQGLQVRDAFGEDGAHAVLKFCEESLVLEAEHIPLWYLKFECQRAVHDVAGALSSLRAVKQLDLAGQAHELRRRAGDLGGEGSGGADILAFVGDLARDLGDLDDAAKRYSEALELPGCPLEAIRAGLGGILDADPNHGGALCAMGRCEWVAGRSSAAASCYRKAISLQTPPAIGERLHALCGAFPQDPEPWLALGELQLRSEEYAEALGNFDRALAVGDLRREDWLQCHRYRCTCHAQLKHYAAAIESIRAVYQAAPDDNAAAAWLIALHFDELEHRADQLRREIADKGASPEILFELGTALKASGEYDGAATAFREAAQSEHHRHRAWLEVAKCQMARNCCDLAVVNLRGILEGAPSMEIRKEVLYHMGVACCRLVQFGKARECFEELCAIDEHYRDAAVQLRALHEKGAHEDRFHLAALTPDFLGAWRMLAKKHRPGEANGGDR